MFREILENHRRQSQQSRIQRGLGLGIVSSGRTIWMLTRIAAKESVSFCVPTKY
jgi:hypothetical protein